MFSKSFLLILFVLGPLANSQVTDWSWFDDPREFHWGDTITIGASDPNDTCQFRFVKLRYVEGGRYLIQKKLNPTVAINEKRDLFTVTFKLPEVPPSSPRGQWRVDVCFTYATGRGTRGYAEAASGRIW